MESIKKVQRDFSFVVPENISYEQEQIEKWGTPSFDAKAEVTEIMGAESYVYLTNKLDNITIRVNGNSSVKPNQVVKLAFNGEKIHVFDKETEETGYCEGCSGNGVTGSL